MVWTRATLLLLLALAVGPASARNDAGRRLLQRNAGPGNATVVVQFNQLGQNAIRSTSTGLQLASKFLALLALAQRTAAVRWVRADMQVAAAAYAGHGVLTRFFPLQSATFDAVMRGYTAGLTDQQRATLSARAAAIAQRLVANSMTDGLSVWADWWIPPVGPQPPGNYSFTPGQTFSLLPQLSRTRPLVIAGPEPFDQGGPLPIDGAGFAADLAEVKASGGSTSVAPVDLATARFWFNGGGTSSSAGQWSDVATSLLPPTTSVYAAADLLYRLNAAMFDASVVCWYAKYKYRFWRPVTAIRSAAANGSPDETWTPAISPTPFHPEHPSGHSCAGGAAGAILSSFWGTDQKTFVVTSDWPNFAAAPADKLPPRTYGSFSAAVQEGMDSRVYAGVHYRRAVNVGRDIGRAVGAAVWAAPGPQPSTVATISATGTDDGGDR